MSTVNSLMTALAEAIRNKSGATGKLSITAMTNAVNGISVNTNPDIDLNGVTVTADKLLSGIVAVNSDGVKITGTIQTVTATKSGDVITVPKGYIPEQQTFNAGVILPTVSVTADKLLSGVTAINSTGETVTGTIPTVTASMSDNVVTVPSGHIASAQTLTVAEMSEPTVSKNVVTVSKGYNKSQKTVTIPLATITETDTQVSIGVGYVSEAKTYELNSSSGDVTATVTVNKNVVTITSGTINAQTVTIPTGRVEKDGARVRVYEGYVENQVIEYKFTEPKLNGNVFSISEGYVDDYYELTVPEANVDDRGDSVYIGVGYIPEAFTVEKGNNALPDVSFTAAGLRKGMTALDSSGVVVEGTMKTVEITLDGNEIYTQAGYVPETYKYVPLASINETSERVTIGQGYIKDEITIEKTSGGGSTGGGSKAQLFCATLIFR